MGLISIVLTMLLGISAHAQSPKIYSVCENCVLESVQGNFYGAFSPEDRETYATMSYFPVAVESSKDIQTIRMELDSYKCLVQEACFRDLTLPAEVSIVSGRDPLLAPNTRNLKTEVKVAGLSQKKECSLGETQDRDGRNGYSYKYGVNLYCNIYLSDKKVVSLNLYFKRLVP